MTYRCVGYIIFNDGGTALKTVVSFAFNVHCAYPTVLLYYRICKKKSKGNSVLNRRLKLSPSALSCDFGAAGVQIKEAVGAGAEYLHLDVMDGAFVPNISFGQPVIKSLRHVTDAVFDVHLMIDEPIRYIEDFAKAGADIITVHVEACEDVLATLMRIKECGKQVGISIKPKTPVSEILPYIHLCDLVLVMTVEPGFGGQKFMADMLPKVTEIRDYCDSHGIAADISVDGGISAGNARLAYLAGANLLVAGSSVFCAPSITDAVKSIISSASGITE